MKRREKLHKQNQARADNLDPQDSVGQYREKEEAFSDGEPSSVEATTKSPVKKSKKKAKKKSKKD